MYIFTRDSILCLPHCFLIKESLLGSGCLCLLLGAVALAPRTGGPGAAHWAALHPVSITRFSITRFSPGSGLLRNLSFYR